jgi:hypothetical protein
MSANLIEKASVSISLLGSNLSEAEIANHPVISKIIVSALLDLQTSTNHRI